MLQTLTLDDLRWMDFIHSRREAHIFHHPCWLKNLEQVYGYRGFFLALLNKEGQVSAGLPMMEVSSPLTGRRWVSVPFSDHCAPLYEGKTALEELTSGLVDLAAQKAIPRMELRWSYPAQKRFTVRSSMYGIRANWMQMPIQTYFLRDYQKKFASMSAPRLIVVFELKSAHLKPTCVVSIR